MRARTVTGAASSSKIQANAAPGKRLLYIDNIRWAMISLVVMMHLKVTYSGQGLWYYNETRVLDTFSSIVFGMYGSFIQAFFMGMLFFAAGYFVPASLDKKGTGKFIRDRIARLGIPTLVFMLLLNPITFLIAAPSNGSAITSPSALYLGYITSLDFLSGSGPLWFALALLIFSAVYASVRFFSSGKDTSKGKINPVSITNARVIVLICVISLFAFLLRLVYPVGATFYNMQIGNFSQYIILFMIGILSYRYDLLSKLPFEFGMFWLKLAFLIGIPVWMLMLFFGGGLADTAPFMGGFFWQAAAYAIWESFFCVGIGLGLLVIFRKNYNVQGKISRFLSKNAFGVYVFHAPLIVVIALMLQGVVIYPLLKMALAAMIALPTCFAFSYFVRKIPLMDKLFS